MYEKDRKLVYSSHFCPENLKETDLLGGGGYRRGWEEILELICRLDSAA
jgi:hypothetical protein